MYRGGMPSAEAEVDPSALENFHQYNDIVPQNTRGQQQEIPAYMLPDDVRDFISYFCKQISKGNTFEIQACVENHYKKLTERYFKDQAWPDAELIAPLVDGDPMFLTLYRELYFRHIYATPKIKMTIENRFESYENYCDLFNYILDSSDPIDLKLPNKWLWDIIDEFIYQFQSFTQYRAKLEGKSTEDLNLLRQSPQIWNVHIVLNVLHSLIEKSNINAQLIATSMGEDAVEAGGEFGGNTLYQMLGYFSIVGLLRLHTLLGDYHQALQVMENITLNRKGLYSRVAACQVTIFYYVGFCYLMMRRYQDAVRVFAAICNYILRTQNFNTRSSGFDMLVKKREQLFHLLAIAITLSPQRVDEGIREQLLEKCEEKIIRMQQGEEAAFKELFVFGCPKFISPVPPNYDAPPADHHMEPLNRQLKLFLSEIRQQALLPTIRSYLKLYTTMPIQKLASYLNMDVEEFCIHLHNYKHKTTQLVWTAGAPLDGDAMTSDDIDFYIDGDMIHIADVKVARCYGEYFIHQINKLSAQN